MFIRAPNTVSRGRINFQAFLIYLLAAVLAPAVVVIFYAVERGINAPYLLLPAPVLFQGHRLLLQGVHAGQPANHALVQFHGFGGVIGEIIVFLQLRP